MSDECTVFEAPSISTFVVSAALAVGIFVSYLPQHIRIIQRRTTEGLSPIFLLLGSTSGCSAFLNLVLLTSQARHCCYVQLTKFQCLNSHLGLIQVGVQFCSYAAIPLLAIIYTRNSITQKVDDYKEMVNVAAIFGAYTTISVFITVYVLFFRPSYIYSFASYSGIVSSILSGVQYFPQIYTTYLLKHAGSLSVKMMAMQTPGGFVWTLTLYLAPNSKWSSWLPYFTAAVLQGVLLCMCVYYSFTRDVKELEEEAAEGIAQENILASESTPLIT